MVTIIANDIWVAFREGRWEGSLHGSLERSFRIRVIMWMKT
jgi:hypothetical protein